MKKILVIDDEPMILEIFSLVEWQGQFEFLCVDNVQEAMKHVDSVDAILADIVMEDGEILSQVLEKNQSSLKVMRMSGQLAKHPYPLISKPFTISEIQEWLKTI